MRRSGSTGSMYSGDQPGAAFFIPWYSGERSKPTPEERDEEFLSTEQKQKLQDDQKNKLTKPAAPEIPKAELSTRLHVIGVDLHIDENSKAHHTNRYECKEDRIRESDAKKMKAELVIRRGQEFKMTIDFSRPYDIPKNDIKLMFSLGDRYVSSKDVRSTFPVDETGKTKYKPRKWGATVVGQSGNKLTLSVFVPASAPVGEWKFGVHTVVDVKDKKSLHMQYKHGQEINVIFNPWCKEDWVYLPDEQWRQETVLNDSGAVYVGNRKKIRAKTWFFGQFENGILDTAYHLLRKVFGKACPGMGNVCTIARLVSQIVNAIDDNGVLIGRWDGKYKDGKHPSYWNGSVRILQEYMDTKKPVKYGQCWVFSAVTTTVCRALGIPCRSVTNFESAHNTDPDNLTIDKIMQEFEEDMFVDVGDDSVWNFHVWNEVWCKRPDLCKSGKWDGWQVIDATPQELSDAVFCCGPAPVKAVKEGELQIGKDCDFIFAEVNADRVTRTTLLSGEVVVSDRKTDSVGHFISTHKPTGRALENNWKDTERFDLTLNYKYEEGTAKEREIVKKAEKLFQVMHGTVPIVEEEEEEEPEKGPPKQPIALVIDEPPETMIGSPVTFPVHVKNQSTETVAVRNVIIRIFYQTYSGALQGSASLTKRKDLMIDPGQEEVINACLNANAGISRPDLEFHFQVNAVANYYDTDRFPVAENLNFQLEIPSITVKGPKSCNLKDPFTIELSFTNPLAFPLTKCDLDLEGGIKCVDKKNKDRPVKDIPPKTKWTTSLTVKATKHPEGKMFRDLSVGFDCYEVKDITGSLQIPVVL